MPPQKSLIIKTENKEGIICAFILILMTFGKLKCAHLLSNIIASQTMSTTQVKDSIVALPVQERVVAVALQHVFNEIIKIQEQQNEEIQQLHQSFISRFKDIQNRSAQIVLGQPIPSALLSNSDQFFTETEKGQVEALAKANKGISSYWATGLANFYGEDLTETDKHIAAAIKNIQTNITLDKIEVVFDISLNEQIKSGRISRQFILDSGRPSKIEGNPAEWIKQQHEGIFDILFSNQQSSQGINDAFTFAGEFINEIVPYSLQFYLGLTEVEDFEDMDEEGEDEEEEEESEEDEVPAKKVKK